MAGLKPQLQHQVGPLEQTYEAVQPHADGPGEPAPKGSSRRTDWTGLGIAALIACVGVIGALLAWRVAVLGSEASLADDAGLTAAVASARSTMIDEAHTDRSFDAYLDYLLHRSAADRLMASAAQAAPGAADALRDVAQREYGLAASHWGFFPAEYIAPDGTYQRDLMVAAQRQEDATRDDLNAAPHVAAAGEQRQRAEQIADLGILLALALVAATCAEFLRGRRRLASIALAVLLAGTIVWQFWSVGLLAS